MTFSPSQIFSSEKTSPISPLLRLPQVLNLVGISQSAWYAGMRRGDYPQPIRIGRRAVAWRFSDLEPLLAHGLGERSDV